MVLKNMKISNLITKLKLFEFGPTWSLDFLLLMQF